MNKGFTPRTIGRLEHDLGASPRQIVASGAVRRAVRRRRRSRPGAARCRRSAWCSACRRTDRERLARIVNEGIEAETGEILGTEQVRTLGRYGAELIRRSATSPTTTSCRSSCTPARPTARHRSSEQELKAFFTLLFPAGAETTRGAIGGGLLAFIEHPERVGTAALPARAVRTAVEEIVRWTTPSVYKRRTATRDVVVAGVPIHEGQKVTYWEMSANRDEAVFADPFRFDVGRDPNPHVGFGFGTHFCLGASLARLEIRVMLEELLDAVRPVRARRATHVAAQQPSGRHDQAADHRPSRTRSEPVIDDDAATRGVELRRRSGLPPLARVLEERGAST